MKKIFLLFLFSAISICTYAQESPRQESRPIYVYCEIVGKQRVEFENKQVKPKIEFGELQSTAYAKKFKDRKGKPVLFNSMVDAMNRMSVDGWEFVQSYIVPGEDFNVFRWLLRKDVDSLTDEDKAEFLLKLNK